MRLLVKLGGALLDEPESRERLASDIAASAASGDHVVVVHGGGKRLTRYLAAAGVPSRFVSGLRVTTPETLDAVVRILAGAVNTELVAALRRAGARPVGLTGADDRLVTAVQLSPELGAVGRIEQVRAELLELLVLQGYLPVVACLAAGPAGELYNVNADQMAAAVAAAFRADRLMFLTDVPGVLDANGEVIARLSPGGALELIARGVAGGGMEAKLRACAEAVRSGVPEVDIAPGARLGVLDDLRAGRSAGTRILPQ